MLWRDASKDDLRTTRSRSVILIRPTARLRNRLRLPEKLPEPVAPPVNPLGEWYADIDFIDREPYVVLLNVATGAGMVLPGRADDLRALHVHAGQQLFEFFVHYGLDPDSPLCSVELSAWRRAPPDYANTRDRSLLGSMNRFKDDAWHHFAFANRSLPEAAARQWEGLFRHPSFAKAGRRYGYDDWQRPLELVYRKLLPAELVAEDPAPSGRLYR